MSVEDRYIAEKTNKNKTWYGIIAFLITTCVWGFAFVPQKLAMQKGIGPITMNGLRFLLGAICLIPVILISDKIKGKKMSLFGCTDESGKKNLLLGGLICGICLTLASTFQQIGVKYTSVGNAGFLSALYIIIVPVITSFFGKKINWNGWAGVIIAIVGMFFLCFDIENLSELKMNKGDLYIIICSLFFSFHILSINKFSPETDAFRLSCIQFFISGTIATIIGAITETSTWQYVPDVVLDIVFLGVGSCGIGYTLQTVGQRYVPAHIAPLLMGLECIFSLIAGWLCLGEVMTLPQYGGCLLILTAVILAQLDFSKFGRKDKAEENSTEVLKE